MADLTVRREGEVVVGTQSTSHGRMPTVNGPARRGRLLIIDDDRAVAMVIERVLGVDHDVTTVYRAQDALERLAAGEVYDAILCDLIMPEMTGMDLYEELLRSAPDLTGRLVFVTGAVSSTVERGFLEHVGCPWLEKPFELSSLRGVVSRLLAN